MQVRESDLPGIGKKFVVETKAKNKLVVVLHDNGQRELYYFSSQDPDEGISVGTLEDDEARVIAGILGGIAYKPKALETIDVAIDDLVIEWITLEGASPCVGKTIGGLNVRQLTGASVIAIVEKDKDKKQINPGPDGVLKAESTVVVAGERSQIKRFKELMTTGK